MRAGARGAAALVLALALPLAARAAVPAGITLTLARDAALPGADAFSPVRVRATLRNGSDHPVFVDSLVMARARVAGGTPDPARSLPVAKPVNGIAEGDSQVVTLTLSPGTADDRVSLALHLHRLHEDAFALGDTLSIAGADPLRIYRPRVTKLAGRAAEVTVLPAAGEVPAQGALLMLRDLDGRAADDVPVASQLAHAGFSVLILSPPGTGGSAGPADFAGPGSLAAARAALDTLAALPGGDKVCVWGAGWGGTLALLLAEKVPALRGVIAQSAFADPWATYRAKPAFAKAFLAAAGRDSAAWSARSPFSGVTFLRSKVLVLHGEKDAVAGADAMHDFVATAHRAGIYTLTATFVPEAGHAVPASEAYRHVRRFLNASMAGP